MLPNSDELKKYLGELKPCIICSGKNLERWAKLDYLEYQYEETPYANPKEDFHKIEQDIILSHSGKFDQIHTSPSFPGSIMTAVWRKKHDR